MACFSCIIREWKGKHKANERKKGFLFKLKWNEKGWAVFCWIKLVCKRKLMVNLRPGSMNTYFLQRVLPRTRVFLCILSFANTKLVTQFFYFLQKLRWNCNIAESWRFLVPKLLELPVWRIKRQIKRHNSTNKKSVNLDKRKSALSLQYRVYAARTLFCVLL